MKRWFALWLVVTLGVTHALSMAWPFAGAFYGQPQGWLEFISLAGFAWFLDRADDRKSAFLLSWCFALAWLVASTWWLYISLHVYGEMPAVLAGLAVVVLSGLLALIYGIAGVIYRWICNDSVGAVLKAGVFTACWFLAEWTRGTVFTGFPWASAGYAHVDSLLRYWAPWIGVYGLGAVSAFGAMWLMNRRADRVAQYSKAELAGLLLVLMVIGVTGWQSALEEGSAPARTPMRVALVQGNVAQDQKFAAGAQQALMDYRQDLLNLDADLIVLPETAIPYFPHQLPHAYWQGLEQGFERGERAALIGVPLMKEDGQHYTNSALAWRPGLPAYRYDKHHLVPFGEFIPPLFQWLMDWLHIPLGSFSRGDVAQAPLLWHNERIAPNICYEDLFGEELAQSFNDPQNAPTVMVNMSNLAWFGNSIALEQSLQIARMRALEFQRPMLRATNTGVTAYIDAQGVVQARLAVGVREILDIKVQGIDAPPTPFARWVGAWGWWPLVGLSMLLLVGGGWKSHAGRHGRRRFGN